MGSRRCKGEWDWRSGQGREERLLGRLHGVCHCGSWHGSMPALRMGHPGPLAHFPLPQQPCLSPLTASLPLGFFFLPQVTSPQCLRLTCNPLFSPLLPNILHDSSLVHSFSKCCSSPKSLLFPLSSPASCALCSARTFPVPSAGVHPTSWLSSTLSWLRSCHLL